MSADYPILGRDLAPIKHHLLELQTGQEAMRAQLIAAAESRAAMADASARASETMRLELTRIRRGVPRGTMAAVVLSLVLSLVALSMAITNTVTLRQPINIARLPEAGDR